MGTVKICFHGGNTMKPVYGLLTLNPALVIVKKPVNGKIKSFAWKIFQHKTMKKKKSSHEGVKD